MKLGESIVELSLVEQRLQRLQASLAREGKQGGPTGQILKELASTANRWIDLQTAIEWTFQQVAVSNKPLGSYRHRAELFRRLAEATEVANREKASDFWEAYEADRKVVETAVWVVDLQIPKFVEATPEEDNDV